VGTVGAAAQPDINTRIMEKTKNNFIVADIYGTEVYIGQIFALKNKQEVEISGPGDLV
jgi:hypothetical protein